MEETLEALPDGTRVNIVVFQEEASLAAEAPVPLDADSRKDLAASLRRTNPGEKSDVLEGLLLALDQPDVDTIFLLTDGAPTEGEFVSPSRVRQAVRMRNRMLKVRIHTVGIGDSRGRERSLLYGLADDSGGRMALRGAQLRGK